MPNFQQHKKKKMTDEQCPPLVTPTMKQQQQPKNSLTLSPENSLPQKTIGINCEVYHLDSLQ